MTYISVDKVSVRIWEQKMLQISRSRNRNNLQLRAALNGKVYDFFLNGWRKLNMARLTCPKCKVELKEVLFVDETVVELEDNNFYQPRETIMTAIKCTRCGAILEQHQMGTHEKIACPNCPSCGMRLDVGIGVMESVMEYNEDEEWYLNAKEVSLPKITRCLNCGADLTKI